MKKHAILTIRNFVIFTYLLVFICCCSSSEKQEWKSYQLAFKSFKWEPRPYLFPSKIQDSVFKTSGKQIASTHYSFIGELENTLNTWAHKSPPRDTLSTSKKDSFKLFKPIVAKPYILAQAQKHKITIINEAHHYPAHRVFTSILLKEMYDLGYRHLGLEALFNHTPSDSSLKSNGYPILTNGYYTREPQFGNLIRQAIKIGYKLFSYESKQHKNAKQREVNQAKNIITYMQQYPNEKILIHCGYGHASEGYYGGSFEKMMAQRLKDSTKIDPLTIDQTSFSEWSEKKYENPYYQITNTIIPSVYINENGESFKSRRKSSGMDIYVFHPRTKQFNKPQWLLSDGKKFIKIDLSNESVVKGEYILLAYKKGEEIGSAVPIDIQVVKNNKVNLALYSGKYNLVLWNKDGESKMTTIHVD